MKSTFLASKPEEETDVAGDPQQPHRHLGEIVATLNI